MYMNMLRMHAEFRGVEVSQSEITVSHAGRRVEEWNVDVWYNACVVCRRVVGARMRDCQHMPRRSAATHPSSAGRGGRTLTRLQAGGGDELALRLHLLQERRLLLGGLLALRCCRRRARGARLRLRLRFPLRFQLEALRLALLLLLLLLPLPQKLGLLGGRLALELRMTLLQRLQRILERAALVLQLAHRRLKVLGVECSTAAERGWHEGERETL